MAAETGNLAVAAWRICMAATTLLALSACSMFAPKFSSPTLSVVSIGTVVADMFSQQFRVRVHVDNPNDRALPVKAIEYSLYLQEDRFAEGESSESFVVPARGETEFDMTVKTSFMSSIARLLSKLDPSGQVDYDLAGKVHVDLPFMKTIPFHQHGKVDLAKLGR